MSLKSSFLFAFRMIFSRRKGKAVNGALGAFLCIALSVIPVVCVLSVTDAMIKGITERLVGLASSPLKAVFPRGTEEFTSFSSLEEAKASVESLSEINGAFMQVECTAMALKGDYRTGAHVRALERDIFERNEYFASLIEVREGRLEDFKSGKNAAVLGEKLARDLKARVGDEVRFITVQRTAGGKVVPKISTFRVCAVVSSGYEELDSLWFFIPIDNALRTVPRENRVVSIMMDAKYSSLTDLYNVQTSVKGILKDASIFRFDEIHASELENFSSTKIMLTLVMSLIILVAAVNISSSLIILVMERRREIAILKSFGARYCDIRRTFLFSGLFLTFFGLLSGLIVGIFLSVHINELIFLVERAINTFTSICATIMHSRAEPVKLLNPACYLLKIPVMIPVLDLAFMSAGVMAAGFMASFFPASRAGKEDVLKIFRKT